MVKIKVLNNLSYQKYPLTEDMIEIDEELLNRIGVDKQFDSNGNVIDYEYVDNNRTLSELDNWFKTDYAKYEQMFNRRHFLAIEDVIVDEFRGKTYHNLGELYREGEDVAKEIRELKEKKM
jgi:hypothetical protein